MKLLSLNKNRGLLYQIQDGKCFYCELSFEFFKLSRDHVYPRSKGGKSKNNIVLACRDCNSEKSSQTVYEFREYTCRKLGEYLRLPRILNADKLQNGSVRKIERMRNIIFKCTVLLNNPNIIFTANKLWH